MESIWTVWKFSGKFPNRPKFVCFVEKISGQSGNFPDGLKSFMDLLGNFFGQFLDSLEQFTYFCIGRENNLRFFGIHVIEQIYALHPESFCASKFADRKVETF